MGTSTHRPRTCGCDETLCRVWSENMVSILEYNYVVKFQVKNDDYVESGDSTWSAPFWPAE